MLTHRDKMMKQTFKITGILLLLACNNEVALAVSGIMFKRTSLPAENWLEIPSGGSDEDAMLMSKSTCATACSLRGDVCHGYELHDDGSCTLGQVQASGSNNFIPEFLMTGKKVYLRSGKVKRKAVTEVNHLATISSGLVEDTAFEDNRFEGLTIPAPFSGGRAILATIYKRNFLTCVGTDASGSYIKKCKAFSFKTQTWTELPGELLYKHERGAAAIAGGKIYAFCGVNAAGAGSREAEVYDFAKGKWEAIPFAPSGYNVDNNVVVAISDTKLLLIAGRWPGVDYTKANHIYNTDTQLYSSVPNRDVGTSHGMHYGGNFGCALMPNGLKVMCAGGWNDWNGNNKRVQFYDIASNTWDTQTAYDLPVAGTTSVTSLGLRTFVVTNSDTYEYKEGENPLWAPLTDTTVPKGFNVFYTMDYTELMV